MKKFSNTGRYFPFVSALDCFILYFQVNLYRLGQARSWAAYQQIQTAINQKAWDSTAAVAFTFMATTIIFGTKNTI
jgi:hypothetical protein